MESEANRLQRMWEEAKAAWEVLKERLIEATTLAFPDFDEPFELHVDRSKGRGFGAGLY